MNGSSKPDATPVTWPKPKPIVLNLRIALLVVCICLTGPFSIPTIILLADYLAWLMIYPERFCDPNVFKKSDWPGQLYELVPGKHFHFYHGSRYWRKSFHLVAATVNSHGFRGPEPPDPRDEDWFRILVLGDSITFGEGVEDNAEYIRIIENAWNRNRLFPRKIAFINTAVGGYNTSQEVAALRRYDPLYKPHMIWLIITLEDTLSWGEVTVNRVGTLYRPGASFRHRVRDAAKSMSGILWWLHQAYRYYRLDQYIPRLFEDDYSGYREWKKALKQYSELVGQYHRSLVFIAPGSWKLDKYPWKTIHEKMKRDIEETGLRCIDLLPFFEGRDASQLWCHPLDLHPNTAAHEIYAQAIGENPDVRNQVMECFSRTEVEPEQPGSGDTGSEHDHMD